MFDDKYIKRKSECDEEPSIDKNLENTRPYLHDTITDLKKPSGNLLENGNKLHATKIKQ